MSATTKPTGILNSRNQRVTGIYTRITATNSSMKTSPAIPLDGASMDLSRFAPIVGPSEALVQRLIQSGTIIEQDPFHHRKRQASALQQVVMKLAEPEFVCHAVLVAAQQAHDLPLANHVGNLLRRLAGGAGSLALRGFAIQATRLHEVADRALEVPLAGVQVHVHPDARRAVAGEPEYLPVPRRFRRIESRAQQHLLGV